MIGRLAACLILAMIIQQAAPSQNAVVIDHLILGINDLERGIDAFERMTGVRPVFGGVHPRRGTQNALASLGDGSYIEVIAPDPKQSVATSMVTELKTLASLTPVGWAVGASNLFDVQARLQGREIHYGGVQPGSRALPDGSSLQWSTFNITQPAHQWLPFFIRWADPAKHPSLTTPRGCSLASLSVEDPNPDPLTHVFSTIGLKVPLKKSDVSRMSIALKCPKGRVSFS